MLRDIRNLVLVVGVVLVGHIDGTLVGVLQTQARLHLADLHLAVGLEVNARDMHLAKVEHRPAELLSFRIGDNLVADNIIVAVGLQGDDARLAYFCRICRAKVILRRLLGFEVAVAHLGIVKVVEGRHAEIVLHKAAYREVPRAERIPVHEEGRGEA